MEPLRTKADPAPPAGGPFAFLITTPPAAHAHRSHLGASAYSYGFVIDALKPVLERLGTCQIIDRPESRLAYAAARASEAGLRPVHLAVAPPHEIYQTPAVPTVLFPFWEFPDIPDRDFGFDTRQNWSRICRPASLILTACRFTAEAFRRADVRCPVAVVPVPLEPEWFEVPAWDPQHAWTLTCRHTILGDDPEAARATVEPHPSAAGPPPGHRSWKHRTWRAARSAYLRIYPWFDPATHRRVARIKGRIRSLARHSPPKLAFLGARAVYKRGIRPWLSDEAIRRISAGKERLLRRAGIAPGEPIDPLLPSAPLTLTGLVYTTLFNVGDLRKNYHDLMSAFLLAFRDRPDVTLVIKLATNARREHHETGILRAHHAALGIRHRCRIVVIAEYLDDDQMRGLFRASTYYVNASYAEGACLPLQQALAAGRPAIAPDHTAMADYIDDQVAFVVRSHPEPTHWPHDPQRRIETERQRPVWSDLYEHFRTSARLAEVDPAGHAALGTAARRRMAEVAGCDIAEAALRRALECLSFAPATQAVDWPARLSSPFRTAG